MVKALREFLTENDMDQQDLADAVGVTQATVSRWISGEIKIKATRVSDISRVTGIPASMLRPDVFADTHAGG